MATDGRRRVAILGGGMAGMSAAWRLSAPGWEERFERITVYQRGWRLGGKGASSRGPNGRIEEHGLHIWLGYYENGFRVMRDVYAELDREQTRPEAPIRTWRDAFSPAHDVGFEDFDGAVWKHWVATFKDNDELPGEPDAPTGPMTVPVFLRRAFELMADFYGSLAMPSSPVGLTLSADPRPPHARPVWGETAGLAMSTLLAAATQTLSAIRTEQTITAASIPALDRLSPLIDRLHDSLRELTIRDDRARRLWSLFDLLVTTARGILADGLLVDPRGFDAINDEDYRHWIQRHGASNETLDSALVRGMYDLTFANQDGDPRRPRFAAGTGLLLSGKLFFEYRGSIFWKMNAGMGDVVFAPLYEALVARGVSFEFFSRVDELHLDTAGQSISAVTLGRQVRVPGSPADYEPLVDVDGMPCFPDAPRLEVVGTDDRSLESIWSTRPDAETVVLRNGVDYDDLVLAIPVGMLGSICSELIEHSHRWRQMVDRVETVATRAFQIWMTENPTGVAADKNVTMTGYREPFDTWSSMDHLLKVEGWSGIDRPRSLVYFCDTLPTDGPGNLSDPEYPKRESEAVRAAAVEFIDGPLLDVWPSAVDPSTGGFRWELLSGADGRQGSERFDTQYWTANVDPSDRYVLSVPGSDRHRMRPDDSGYDNLYLAGDWTDSGLNAGCVEAATMSGLQAANAVLGHDRWDGLLGFYPRREREA